MTQREVLTLQLCGGGSPLSAREQAQAARIVQLALKADRAQWLKDDANSAQVLKRLAAQDAVYISGVREDCRLNTELGTSSVPALQQVAALEGAIIKAHDPTVLFDRASKRLVTERSLIILLNSVTLTAKLQGLPAPSSAFFKVVRQHLKPGFVGLTPEQADGLAHIGRDSLYIEAGMSVIPAARRPAMYQATRNMFRGLSPTEVQWQLATNAAEVARASHSGLIQLQTTMMNNALYLQKLTNRQIQQNVWQLGNPGCAPGGDANFEQCQMDAPINQPLPIGP